MADNVNIRDASGNSIAVRTSDTGVAHVQHTAWKFLATGSMQSLTVDNTAGGVQFSAFTTAATHIILTHEAAQMRMTFDGTAPTSASGFPVNVGDMVFVVFASTDVAAMKFIRTGSTSAVVWAQPVKVD